MEYKRHTTGRLGENGAVSELERRGYRILERNYRCRFGEIDVVAKDGSVVVFIEVKTRSSFAFGAPAASVDERKQRKLLAASEMYLQEKGLTGVDARFDVVCVEVRDKKTAIEVIRDAFAAPW